MDIHVCFNVYGMREKKKLWEMQTLEQDRISFLQNHFMYSRTVFEKLNKSAESISLHNNTT